MTNFDGRDHGAQKASPANTACVNGPSLRVWACTVFTDRDHGCVTEIKNNSAPTKLVQLHYRHHFICTKTKDVAMQTKDMDVEQDTPGSDKLLR